MMCGALMMINLSSPLSVFSEEVVIKKIKGQNKTRNEAFTRS